MSDEVDVRGLKGIDPRTVPLPNGTQVTLTVEYAAGERPIAVGSVGTVVSSESGDRYVVRIVGRGTHTFAREHLRAAKSGQMRFAAARAHDEAALRPCVVLEATVG